MVRYVVAALVQAGAGRLPPADVRRVLAARDNSWGRPVPPHGLYLAKVEYPAAAYIVRPETDELGGQDGESEGEGEDGGQSAVASICAI
eukprot:SAG22_NODE_1113_length_5533_cov_5.884063_3_plen_89_part_00